jgi:diguanylate cyclase (GGDEF)-like protein
VVGFGVDVSPVKEEVEEEAAGLDHVQRLRRIIEIQRQVVAAGLEPDAVMQVITERAQEMTGADGAVVELVDDDELVYRAGSGTGGPFVGTRLSRFSSLSGLCVEKGRGLLSVDTDHDRRVDQQACRRIGLRSMVVVPLLQGELVVGVLKVMSAAPNRFDQMDMEMLELLSSFLADVISNASSHDEVTHDALHDRLTGLPNRTLLIDRLTQALRKGRRGNLGTAVFFMDLDRFKAVNDTLGHQAGDRLLKTLAEEWSTTLRSGDTLARFGGDEFVLVCENADRHASASIRLRLSAGLARTAGRLPREMNVAVSIGTAWTADPDRSPDELLAAADASMYRVKQRSRLAP